MSRLRFLWFLIFYCCICICADKKQRTDDEFPGIGAEKLKTESSDTINRTAKPAKGEIPQSPGEKPEPGSDPLSGPVTDPSPADNADEKLYKNRSDNGFIPYFLGSGVIDNLKGGKVQLASADRIKVLILAEGYKQEDLSFFNKDVKEFIEDLERIEPFKTFKNAFEIWGISGCFSSTYFGKKRSRK